MHTQTIGAKAHKARSAWVLIAGLGIAAGGIVGGAEAWAQAALPPTGDAPSEALRRQALSPYRFILQNANAPARTKPAAAPEAKAEPKAEAKRPATPSPVEQAAAQPRPAATPASPSARSASPSSSSSAPSTAVTPAAQPAPEPVAVLAPKPAEPPAVAAVRREIIPIQTDEPRLSAALMRGRPSGVVKVAFDVMPDGSTSAVKVVSSTNRDLNRASVEAVSHWKFQPVDEVLTVETELAYKFD